MIVSIVKESLNSKVLNELEGEKGTWYVLKGFGTIQPCCIAIPKRLKDSEPKKLLRVIRIVDEEKGAFFCLKILDKSILFNKEWLALYDGAYAFLYNVRTGKRTQPSLVPLEAIANSMVSNLEKEQKTEEIGKWVTWSNFE